jgi:hypothetical protein
MNVPDAILGGMRKTNEVFCSTVVKLRDMNALDQVYTPEAHILPPGAAMIHGIPHIKDFWLQAITGLDVKDASLTTMAAPSLAWQGAKSFPSSTSFTGNVMTATGNGIQTSGT